MPFEFTGKLPALPVTDSPIKDELATDSPPSPSLAPHPFASFGGTAAPSGESISFGKAPTFGATASFGSTSSFGAASFGRPASPWSSTALPPSKTAKADVVERAEKLQCDAQTDAHPTSNSVISRALDRAVQQKPAFFGVTELGADDILEKYLASFDISKRSEKLESMIKELAELGDSHPNILGLFRHVFTYAADLTIPTKATPRTIQRSKLATPTTTDTGDDDDDLRAGLVPLLHNKLVELEWSSAQWSSLGYPHDERARIAAYVITRCKTKEEMLQALREEDIGGPSEDEKLEGFVGWAMELVETARQVWMDHFDRAGLEEAQDEPDAEAERSKNQESEENNEDGTEEATDDQPFSALSYFRSKATSDLHRTRTPECHHSSPTTESIRCCDQKPESTAKYWINAHLYLTDDEISSLATWMVGKIESLTNADVLSVCKMVLDLLKSHEPESVLKARCKQELYQCFLDDTDAFVDELFWGLATKAYVPATTPSEFESAESTWVRSDQPFRFLDLPPELRTWIYREAMIPGTVRLRSCGHYVPYEVSPSPTPGLLSVCKQVNHEVKDLLYENIFIADALVDDTTRRMFHVHVLPTHILPRVVSLVIVFHYHRSGDDWRWRQLRTMTSLKNLTICGIQDNAGSRHIHADNNHWKRAVQNILESAPADCVVDFGPRTAAQSQHMMEMIRRLGGEAKAVHVETHILQDTAREIETTVAKGSKSGQTQQASANQFTYLP